jgi:streptomycin 6-kinase
VAGDGVTEDPLPSVVVPDALAASHRHYSGPAGERWVAGLPGLAVHCLQRWRLRRDGPVAFGAVALVLPVLRRDGTPAALKLQPVTDETVGEPEALRLWAGSGAVRLLEHEEESGSMLLERLDPGRSLHTVPDDLEALEVIAGLLVRLNAHRASTGFRRLADLTAATLAEVPEVVAALPDEGERRLLTTCADRLSELLADPVDDRLLHWDLHYANVLAALPDGAAEPWSAIDPKPLSGDPGFELLPALWNRWDDVVATGDVVRAVRRRFDLMTDVMGLDRERAAGWTLARVLQNAVWDLGRLGQSALVPAHRGVGEALLGLSG